MRKSNTMIKSNLLLAVVLLAVLVFAIAFSVFDGSIAVAADTLDDITPPETGFKPVVHYEFKDETNLGKDSLGNYDLVAKNVGIDPINGGVALKDNGFLYAPALATGEGNDYTDFSDLVKGSFSISFRAYLRNNNGGGNDLITTGSYGSHFTMNWVYGGFGMNFGNSQNQDFMNDGSKDMLSGEFAWYRVNVVYDESDLTVKLVATKEGADDYSFTMSKELTEKITFGGHSQYGFTIGAQSHLGSWDDGHANAELSDGTKIWPNISDFRLYSGVIDDEEIAAIKKYDVDNAKPVQYYDANPIAQYTFNDAENIGKDAKGNTNLILKSNSSDDYSIADGAITLKNKNLLYAQNLGNGQDIADKLDAFTIALDVKMANPGEGEFDILSVGKFGEALRVTRCNNQLRFYVGKDKSEWKDNAFLDNDWQTIIVTGSVSERYMAIYMNKPGDTAATLVASVSDWDVVLANRCSLTFGGDSYFGGEDCQYSNPTLKNINIYDFRFGAAQATQYLTEGKVEVETVPVDSVTRPTTTLRVDRDMTNDEILACALPETVQTTNKANKNVDAKIVWNNVEKGDFSVKLTGFLLGVNNQENVKVELSVPYAVSDEEKQDIKPLVWYQFKDAENIGKDSMGNFDLKLGGNGKVEQNAKEGYVTFTRENESYLYAPAISSNTNWSDLLKGGYTFSYTVNADNSIQAGDRYAVTTSKYGDAFLIYGCYNGFEVIYSAGGFGSHKLIFETGSYKDTWVTITVTVDPEEMMSRFYVDGALFAEREISDYQGFAASDLYTFAIGGQANINDKDGAQFFEGSIADVRVYDFALSSDNVADLRANKSSENPLSSVPTYYTVKDVVVDTTDLDLVISSENTLDDILASLPSTVTVKGSKEGQEETCNVIWLGRDGNVIEGYVQGASWANVSGKLATVELSYVIEFGELEKGEFSEIKVGDAEYNGEALKVGESKTLTFKVVPQKGYKVASVVCNNNKVEPVDGVYTVAVEDYSKVVAYISAEEYKITYVLNNGEENEEQIYGYNEEVELATYFTREGYDFEGWYRNQDLTGDKVETIDSSNPENITLYAKWTAKSSQGGSDDQGSQGGSDGQGEQTGNDAITPSDSEGLSGGAIAGIVIAAVVVVAGVIAAVVIIRKRSSKK